MHGIVNKTFREFLIKTYGEDKWDTIRDKADAEDVYIPMEVYPDETTVAILVAASEVLSIDAAVLLQDYGEYWVMVPDQSFGHLFEMAGDNFVEFVENLDNLHVRIGQMIPNLKPPSFSVTDKKENSFTLHYYSPREGLFPFVQGLMRGLGIRFKTKVECIHTKGAADGLDHDEFLVNYQVQNA